MKNRIQFSLFIFLLVLIQIPMFLLGEDAYIPINDTLNLGFVQNHLLRESGNIFSLNINNVIDNIALGLEIKFFNSLYNLSKLFYLFTNSFDAYIYNVIFIRIIGFISMMRLLKDYSNVKSNILINLISFSFASIPISGIMGLTILGQPIVILAFTNLYNNKKLLLSSMLLLLYVLYSEFALVTPFILIWLTLLIIYFIVMRIKISRQFYFGFFLLIILSIIINYPMISTLFLEGDNQSFRVIRENLNYPSFFGVIYTSLKIIFFGEVSVSLFVSIPIIALFTYKLLKKEVDKIHWLLVSIIILNSLLFPLSIFISSLGEYLPILSAFNFGRFIFLNPILFFVLLALLVKDMNPYKSLLLIFIPIIAFNLLRNMEFYYNTISKTVSPQYIHLPYDEDRIIKSLFSNNTYNYAPYNPHSMGFYSFKQFFSKKIFKEIEDFLDVSKNDYRVASLGIHPSVLQFNGFKTLGGYNVNFPIKKLKILEKVNFIELEKNKKFQLSNTLQLFSSDLYSYCNLNCFDRYKDYEIKDFQPDISELKKQGVKFIFSSSSIQNHKNLNFDLLNIFKENESPYIIFVYLIN
tara:strand:+ start:10208 stop:11944 length:1737 start_codon:yes stop_codon:yes gene_type:complete